MITFYASEADRRAAIVADHNRVAEAINCAQAEAARIKVGGWREKLDPDLLGFSMIDRACIALQAGDWVAAEELLELHLVRLHRQAGGAATSAKAERRAAKIREDVDMLAYRTDRKGEVFRLSMKYDCSASTVERALSE